MANIQVQKDILPLCSQTELIEAGIDEAGRGCLAGPVFAAAVILPPDFTEPELTDSKKLSEKKRYALRKIIEKEAVAWAVASSNVEEIDRINILQASVSAMHRSVEKLKVQPAFLSIDGNYFRKYKNLEHRTFIGGDGRFLNIAAASILAKTHRDDFMLALHNQYPQYGWDKNKGYGTLYHRDAINQHGRCPEHRNSFRLKAVQLNLTIE